MLGVVVLTLENEEDDNTSWAEYSRRVGCGPTILSMMYDQVLEEQLLVGAGGYWAVVFSKELFCRLEGRSMHPAACLLRLH